MMTYRTHTPDAESDGTESDGAKSNSAKSSGVGLNPRSHTTRLASRMSVVLLCLSTLFACGQPAVVAAPLIAGAIADADAGADGDAKPDGGGPCSTDNCATPDDGKGADTAKQPDIDRYVGPTTTEKFTGFGAVKLKDLKSRMDFRVIELVMYETTKPSPTKVYVWWMRYMDGELLNFGALPYEDQPYAKAFSVSVDDTGDPKEVALARFRRAFVTYENDATADTLTAPTGPIVWQGELDLGTWKHVHHVISQAPGNKGEPGYIQTAAGVIGAIKIQMGKLKTAMKGPKLKVARVNAENVHTLLVGDKSATDINGDGLVARKVSPFNQGLARGDTALNRAAYHANAAYEAMLATGKASKEVMDGKTALKMATDGFNSQLTTTLQALKDFAGGGTLSSTEVEKAVASLFDQFASADVAVRLFAELALKIPKP